MTTDEVQRYPGETAETAWLRERQSGVGGSDIAAICGLDKYRSAWGVYQTKVGEVDPEPPSEAARWGSILQDAIGHEWARRNRVGLIPGELLRAPGRPFILGTPDYTTDEAPPRLVEVKTVNSYVFSREWDEGLVVPANYQCQVQHYLGLTGLARAVIVALVAGTKLVAVDIFRDDEAIERLWSAAERFWTSHVEPRRPPPADGFPETRRAIEARYVGPPEPVRTILPEQARELVREYIRLRDLGSELRKEQTAMANQLRELLGEAGADEGALPGDSEPIVTWRPVNSLDAPGLVATLTDEQRERFVYPSIVDIANLEREIGREALAEFRRPTESRRLSVRGLRD